MTSDLSNIITDILALRMMTSSKLALIRLAVADGPMSMTDLCAALVAHRKQAYRMLAYPIAKGWVTKTTETHAGHMRRLYSFSSNLITEISLAKSTPNDSAGTPLLPRKPILKISSRD